MAGDRGENLGRAVACYEEALRFYTPEAAPLDYAMTQNNLGFALLYLETRDRRANLELALEHSERSLSFQGLSPWTRTNMLLSRGLIQLALGHLDQALDDHRTAIAVADAITLAEARKDLEGYAAEYPDTPGLDKVRALFENAGKE